MKAAPIGIHLRKPKNAKMPPIRTFLGVLLSFPSFGRGLDLRSTFFDSSQQQLSELISRGFFALVKPFWTVLDPGWPLADPNWTLMFFSLCNNISRDSLVSKANFRCPQYN